MYERESWWTLNLAVHKVGGVLMNHLGRMGWSYRRILGRNGGSFQVTKNLRWEMVPRLVPGIICGVEDKALMEGFPYLYSYCLR
jgi:hypothetical protein